MPETPGVALQAVRRHRSTRRPRSIRWHHSNCATRRLQPPAPPDGTSAAPERRRRYGGAVRHLHCRARLEDVSSTRLL